MAKKQEEKKFSEECASSPQMTLIHQNDKVIELLQECVKLLKDISKNTFPGH